MSYDFSNFEAKARKSLEHVSQDLNTLRTGRATTQMLDTVQVEAYGTYMKLIEVASVQAPDPSLLVVSPWDKGLLASVEKAIASSGLNLNPVVDGDIIRIAVPALTEEKRMEMVKLLHQKIESGRVMLRNIRSEFKKEIEDFEGTGGVSEDDIKQHLETLEKKFKEFVSQLEQLSESKEKELLTI